LAPALLLTVSIDLASALPLVVNIALISALFVVSASLWYDWPWEQMYERAQAGKEEALGYPRLHISLVDCRISSSRLGRVSGSGQQAAGLAEPQAENA
jgi:hypothetical protein